MKIVYLIIAALFALCYLLTYTGKWLYLGDIAANFPQYFIIFGIPLFLAAFISGNRLAAMVFIFIAVVEILKLIPFYIKPETPETAGEKITIIQYNHYYLNRKGREVFEWMKSGADGADFVAIEEAVDEVANELHMIKNIFPYQVTEVGETGRRNIVILSKLPILKSEMLNFRKEQYFFNHFYLKVELETPKKNKLTLFVTHLSSPYAPKPWEIRNLQLENFAEEIARDTAQNKIAVGDINVTANSIYFKKFIEVSGLNNSMLGQGFDGTWPSFVVPGFLRVGIDHLLYTGNIKILSRQTLPARGSDHLPVKFEVEVY